MFIEEFFTLEQDGQKSGGAMPPSLKSGGATAPPGSAAYDAIHVHDFRKPFAFISFNYVRSLATRTLKRCFLMQNSKNAYSTGCRSRDE